MFRLIQSRNRYAIATGCPLLLLCLCLAGWGIYSQVIPRYSSLNEVDDSTPLATFDDPSLDFLIDYPRPWDASHLRSGLQGDYSVMASITGLGTAVYIREIKYAGQVTLDQVMTDRQNAWRKSIYPDDKFTLTRLSVGPTVVDRAPALLAEYETETVGKTIFDVIFGPRRAHVLELYVIANSKADIITFYSSVTTVYPNYSHYVNIYHRMIQSIRFR